MDGEFYINNKFFRLDLDFKPEESVIYNKGQGYNKIRTSVTDPNVKDQMNDETPSNFEWSHYSIEQLKKEWSPSDFEK